MGMFGKIAINELKKNGEEIKDKETEDPDYTMDDGEEETQTPPEDNASEEETPSESSEDDTVPDYSMSDAEEETPPPDDGEIPDDAVNPPEDDTETPPESSEDDTVPDYSMSDAEEETPPVGDTPPPEGDTTPPDDSAGDAEAPRESSEDDTVPDYSMGDTEEETPPADDTTPPEDGGDTNYSMDDSGTEETPSDGSETEPSTDTAQTPDQGMQQIEADINKGLSDQEIDIRNTELKKKYVELFNIVKNISSRLESISKTEDNAATIDFISDKTIELKQMIFDYLDTTYATQTYIKNYTTHQEYLMVLTGIKKLFDEIKPKNKDDKQK